jgi:hypothetical protein
MNLAKVIRHYEMFYRPRKEKELDWFRSQAFEVSWPSNRPGR